MIGFAEEEDDDDDTPVATGSEPSNASDDSKRDVIDDVVDLLEAVEELRDLVATTTVFWPSPSPVIEDCPAEEQCSSPF